MENAGKEGNKVLYRWTVADTGIGMSEEFLPHLFDPFVQEKVDARSVYHGTGLGMSIVKDPCFTERRGKKDSDHCPDGKCIS